MVDRQSLREAVFGTEYETGTPSFFDSAVAAAFSDPIAVDLLRDRLVDHVLGVQQIDNQPLKALITQDLDQLIVELTAQCGACDAERTRSIAKGLCASVLASAPIMVH